MAIVSKIQAKQLVLKFKDLGKSVNSVRFESTHVADCPVNHHLRKDQSQQYNEPRPFEEIPGPKPLPIIGNIFRFLPFIGEYSDNSTVKMITSLRENYGEIAKLGHILGRRTNVFIFNPEEIEKLYRLEGQWPMRFAMETMTRHRELNSKLVGGPLGLIASQGKEWHDFRKIVNQYMVQPRAIKPYVTRVDQVARTLVEKMRKLCDTETSKLPPTFNNEMNKWALESTCAIALDHRMGCLDFNLPKDSEAQRMITAVQDMFDLVYSLEMTPSPWRYYDTPALKKLFKSFDTIIDISSKHIDAAEERFHCNPKKNEEDRSVFENLFLIDKQIAYVMALDMFFGGSESTGNASSNMLYHMATNQETQEKLREEIIRHLPEKDSPVTFEILNDIPYLKACIKESLRLSPFSVGNLRTTTKDIVLSGYKIPSGTAVVPCHAILAQDSKYFPEPKKFIAERWLRENTGPTSAKEAHPFTYMPFGFGPRSCIGQRIAKFQMETLILRVLRNFRLEWTGGPLKTKDRLINTVTSPLEFKLTEL